MLALIRYPTGQASSFVPDRACKPEKKVKETLTALFQSWHANSVFVIVFSFFLKINESFCLRENGINKEFDNI